MQAWRSFSRGVLLVVAGLGLTVVSGCETNPYTGRSQLLMTSVSEDTQLGTQAYSQVKNDPKLKQSHDSREIEPVKRVAARIIEAAKRSKYSEIAHQFQWEVIVIKDDKTMNAFALPGGKIASNIAEGCGRQSAKDTINFLHYSRGSLYELETQ